MRDKEESRLEKVLREEIQVPVTAENSKIAQRADSE